MVSQDQNIRIWHTVINNQTYDWHYIWLPDDNAIYSVSLHKGGASVSSPGQKPKSGLGQVFYLQVFAVVVKAIVSRLLQDH